MRFNRNIRLFLWVLLAFSVWRTIASFQFGGVVFVANESFWPVLSISLLSVIVWGRMLDVARWLLLLGAAMSAGSAALSLYSGIDGESNSLRFSILAFVVAFVFFVAGMILSIWKRELVENRSGIDIL